MEQQCLLPVRKVNQKWQILYNMQGLFLQVSDGLDAETTLSLEEKNWRNEDNEHFIEFYAELSMRVSISIRIF